MQKYSLGGRSIIHVTRYLIKMHGTQTRRVMRVTEHHSSALFPLASLRIIECQVEFEHIHAWLTQHGQIAALGVLRH